MSGRLIKVYCIHLTFWFEPFKTNILPYLFSFCHGDEFIQWLFTFIFHFQSDSKRKETRFLPKRQFNPVTSNVGVKRTLIRFFFNYQLELIYF